MPGTYALGQNYPNPFNPTTTIPFTVPEGGIVELRVYNVLGQEVATLVDEYLPAGTHEVSWEARGLSSGTYLYVIKAASFTQTRRMILVK
ncbi:MAG: T9SS type A sorting domain-containing protein [Rhodothermales bacterium]